MNPLCAAAVTTAAQARRIYDPAVGQLISSGRCGGGQVCWAGDMTRLRALIDGVHRDAARLEAARGRGPRAAA